MLHTPAERGQFALVNGMGYPDKDCVTGLWADADDAAVRAIKASAKNKLGDIAKLLKPLFATEAFQQHAWPDLYNSTAAGKGPLPPRPSLWPKKPSHVVAGSDNALWLAHAEKAWEVRAVTCVLASFV